jgi:hypothetical protein
MPSPPKDNNFNWDEVWRQPGATGESQGFDFGNIAVCERCGVTMPAEEARMIPRIIYREVRTSRRGFENVHGRLVAETTTTDLVVCPRCLQAVIRKNRWYEIRHWLLLAGVGVICVVVLLLLTLFVRFVIR